MKSRWLPVALFLSGVACASHHSADIGRTAGGRSDRALWEDAQKAVQKNRWEEGKTLFKRLVDSFPNSELLPDARLGLADCYFHQAGHANYVLAISEYRQYLTLYPSSNRSDYAQFQVGESYYQQRHSPERDQTPLHEALEEFQKVVDLHAQSPYATQAQTRIKEIRQSLARGDFLVGLFYQRTRRAYRSSVLRYQALLSHYPEYEHTDEVLFRLSQCLVLAGRKAEAPPHLHRLLEAYPDSQFASDARQLLATIEPATEPPATGVTDGKATLK